MKETGVVQFEGRILVDIICCCVVVLLVVRPSPLEVIGTGLLDVEGGAPSSMGPSVYSPR